MTAHSDTEVFIPANKIRIKVDEGDVVYFHANQADITPGDAVCFVSTAENQIDTANTGVATELVGVALENTYINTTTGKPYSYNDDFPQHWKVPVAIRGIVRMVAGSAGCTAGKDVIITNANGVVVDGTTADRVVGKALNTAASGASVAVKLSLV